MLLDRDAEVPRLALDVLLDGLDLAAADFVPVLFEAVELVDFARAGDLRAALDFVAVDLRAPEGRLALRDEAEAETEEPPLSPSNDHLPDITR